MNVWLGAALALMVGGLGPALLVASRGDPLDRLVGLELGGTVTTVVLLLLARGVERPSYVDVALVLAVLTFAGTLVFTRYLGRSL